VFSVFVAKVNLVLQLVIFGLLGAEMLFGQFSSFGWKRLKPSFKYKISLMASG
jgi:hypothetical protein